MYPFYHRPKLDIFEVMIYARPRVFVRVSDDEYLHLHALKFSLSVMHWCRGYSEPVSITYIYPSAELLGLFDGQGWNIPALANWLERHCAECFQPLTGRQQRYHSNACKQKAYRRRKRLWTARQSTNKFQK